MFKIFLLILCSFKLSAQNPIDLKNEVMKNLSQFKPHTVLPNYNEHPYEENIHPEKHEDFDYLKSLGHDKLKQESEARFIYENESRRVKIAVNEKEDFIKDAEKIIENAEDSIFSNCHYEPVPCDENTSEHFCHEKAVYQTYSCEKNLNVVLDKKTYLSVKRMLLANQIYDLSRCLEHKKEPTCQPENLLQITPKCEHLTFKAISSSGQEIQVIKHPSCNDTTFSLNGKGRMIVKLEVQEAYERDVWEQAESCDFQSQYFCIPKEERCTEVNHTKNIEGNNIARACWKTAQEFDCVTGFSSDCDVWKNQGCSNTSAQCLVKQGERCDEIERTYKCTEKTCYPDKKVCVEALPCVDGSCDHTKNEESDDIQEGISRLGVVAGSAEEVSSQQTSFHPVEIFKGERKACSEMPLGLRDCCKGEGFLEGVFHCPADLRELQRAKLERRAILVGTYNESLGLKKIYVYCIFPTKLAGVLQIQGRFGQLGIGFGDAENPKCGSGFTSNLLEEIDFKKLDLSPIVNDFKAKAQFKSLEEIENDTKNHVKELHNKGRSHD